jgi:Aspartyl protease
MEDITASLVHDSGAIVRVEVGLSIVELKRRRHERLPIPQMKTINALIDTGTQITCLSPDCAKSLDIPLTGVRLVNAPGITGVIPTTFREIRLSISTTTSEAAVLIDVPYLPIAELDLTGMEFDAVLGRDVLKKCVFIYDGPNESFTLKS